MSDPKKIDWTVPAKAADEVPECAGCRAVLERDLPPFDEDEARRILAGWKPVDAVGFIDGNPTAAEVRRRWPRRTDTCLVCGARTLVYASYMHYVLGDW